MSLGAEAGRPLRAIQQIQIGSIASTEESAARTLRALAEAGFEAIELNGFMTRPTPLFVRALTKAAGMPVGAGGRLDWRRLVADAGLSVIALHEDLGTIESEPHAVVERARRFGARFVVVTGMHRFDYSDEPSVADLVHRLGVAGRRLSSEGIELLYHNHNAEFRRVSPGRTAFEMIVAETDPAAVGFEFDCFWPASVGADPLDLMRALGERVRLMHLTDRGSRATGRSMTPMDKADSVELGAGNMRIDDLVRQAIAVDAAAVILETHRNWVDGSPLRSAEISAAVLRRLLT